MGGSSDTSEDETAVSHSWDTISPDSPPIQRRTTFSHYTQVRHNGYLTKRFKLVGPAASPWSRQFCTVHGNILRCFAGKRQFSDLEDPVETNIIRGVRPWEAEFSKPYNRGLLIDCEGGDTIIARTDTAAEQEEWTEALGMVTELLGNSSGGGGAAGGVGYDSDDEDEGEQKGMQITYLAQKDELLSAAEATGACVVVFQVAKTTLRRVDDVDVGRFNNGDVYLVMHAVHEVSGDVGAGSGGVTRTLFYWVGSKASMDKGTVACIKAVELRRALPGPCSIRREDEGQESPEFLVLFDEVTVADEESGARVLSKVKRWNEQPPIMYSVRMRTSANEGDGNPRPERYHRPPLHSSFTVGRIDLDEDQLGSERVLLVDDRNGHVYLWFGTMSTFKHRGFGLEAATRLKADSPKGGQVVQVDEDDEPPELRRILDRARKQRLLELQVRAAEGDENGAEEEGAEQRRMSLMGASAEGAGPAVSLFRVTQASGGLQLSLVACTSRAYIEEIGGDELEPEQDGAPMLSMLERDAAFILDVFTEVFVWIGDDADRMARIGAGKVAQQLVHAVSRPRWAEEITHVRDDREPFLFLVKFFDWGVARQRRGGQMAGPKNDLASFHKAIRSIAEVQHDPEEQLEVRSTGVLLAGMEIDLPHPADAAVEAAGAGNDDGFGELLMWRVHPKGLVSVPEEEFGHVQSSHSYVFLYGHDAAGGRDDDEDEEESNSSTENDSLLSGLDGREGMSDDEDVDNVDDYEEPQAGGKGRRGKSVSAAAARRDNNDGRTPTPEGRGGGKAAGGGGGGAEAASTSKRKTMFAEMRRESMAGSLQPTAKKGGRRPRRDSSGDSDDEDFEKMEVPREEEEEEEEEVAMDDDDDVLEPVGGSDSSRSKKGKRAKSSIGGGGSSRRNGSMSDLESDEGGSEEGSLVLTITSDDEEERGQGSGQEEGSDGGDGAEPRFLIYFWAGTRAKKSDWVLWKLELAKSMIPEWQKVIRAKIPQIQVAQGQEPLHFRRLFGQGRDHGRLIVHDRVWRKRDNPEKRVSLFKVQRVPEGEFQTFQVPPSVGSLNSMDVFVCICTVVTDDWVGNNDEAVYFWVGSHATLALQEHGAKVLMALMEYYCMPADFNVSILEEDELYDDHAQLWDELSEMLGGEVAWANWNGVFEEDEFDADEDLGCVPKLYVADTGTGNVVLTYVGHIQRACLMSESVAVLDTVEGVYVWRGIHADSSQYELICRASQEYCLNKPLPVGRRVIRVKEGQEPLVFRARFQAWDDGGPGEVKKFQDVYEQRVVQMSKEGTLGDMTALRGRVMGDEEAAKYWDNRGAEPGGQGVRSGVFRDDPASRSTQRRGAPGRKAWVKPPPKPVVVDKSKKLDARRNFLALKDRFEGGGGEAFSKPMSRTFSRRSLLQARQESIALGHSANFKESVIAAKSNRRANGLLDDDDGGDDGDRRKEQEDPDIDPQIFLSRHSWGSASSARRRHSAAKEAQAAAARVRKSAESAAAPQNPSGRRVPALNSALDSTALGRRGSRESAAEPAARGGKVSVGSPSGSADAGEKASLHSSARSAANGGATTSAPTPARAVGKMAVGGWVREEVSNGPLSLPAQHPHGRVVVGRWVRCSSSRDSSASVSPVPVAARSSARGGAAHFSAGEKGPSTPLGSTAAEVVAGDGGRSPAVVPDADDASGAGDIGPAAAPRDGGVRPSSKPVGSPQTKDEVLDIRWGEMSKDDNDRDSFEAEVLPRRGAAAGDVQPSGGAEKARRSRSRSSGSIVGNEGLQEALEQAEHEERRRSSRISSSGKVSWHDTSGGAGGADAREESDAPAGRMGAAAKAWHTQQGRVSGGGGGGDAAVRDDDQAAAAAAYSLALARVRHETVQEGLRKNWQKELSASLQMEEDGGKTSKPSVVSIKHAMSRVKAGGAAGGGSGSGSGGGPAVSDAPPAGDSQTTDGSRLKAALRASIESRTSSNEGTGADGDDDDLDSPRNRGRQYDDRWKMPGHAESVLASFVERLEHRGLAVDAESGGGCVGGEAATSGETSAAAALAEARASRDAAVEILGRGVRPQPERAARNSPGPSAVLEGSGRRRRSKGAGARGGTGRRSRGKDGAGKHSENMESVEKGGTAAGTGLKRSSSGVSGGSGGSAASGTSWSKFGSMALSSIQRAAEAFVGASKDAGEEVDYPPHRADAERTRKAVTAFLSSSRRAGADDKDQE